jgi:hypothetical protein
MSTPQPNQPSASPKRPGDPAGTADLELPFDEQLRAIWERKENRTTVYTGCIAVALMILGWYGYKAFVAAREHQIEAAYTAAAATPARLRSFALEYQGRPLAGVAYLKLADEEYASGNYTAAVDDYDRAAGELPVPAIVARALLGKAVSQIRSGKTSEGTAGLVKLAEDATKVKAVRTEAAYHVASMAFDAGNFDDVTKFTNLIMQIDAGGVWAQRAMQLQLEIPASARPTAGPVVPSVTAKIPGS